jgi:hypothetical protein
MAGIQTVFVIITLPVLAIGFHELTHLAVARITSPFSVEHISWIPFKLRLDFDRMPSQATLRVIALAPLLVGSVAAISAIQTGIWQQIKTADPYYLNRLVTAYWLLYGVPSPTDVRLAIWPSAENKQRDQMTP